MGSVTHVPVIDRKINRTDYHADHLLNLEASDIEGALGYVPADNSDLANYAPASHTHDDRYYTEAEVDALLAASGNTYRTISIPIIATPEDSEVLAMWTPPVGETVVFPDNFAGATGKTLGNPASTYVMDVQLDGVSVGTISVSTSGVFTFNTTGTTVTLVGGTNWLTVVAPFTPDSAFENATVTLKGDI